MRLDDGFPPETAPFGAVDSPDADWQSLGSLASLSIRVAKEPAPRPVTSARAIAGFGLAGDRHASPQSPRQLLLTGSAAYRRWSLPAASLRENLCLEGSTAPLASGDLLRVGEEVILRMMFLCEPCSLLERRCPGTLKVIGADRGMLARVVRGGEIRAGDAVALRRAQAPRWSNEWQERVLHVARAVPEGAWIGYRQLAQLAGVHTAYCRAFPRVLTRLPHEVASRVKNEINAAAQWSGAGLFDFTVPAPG